MGEGYGTLDTFEVPGCLFGIVIAFEQSAMPEVQLERPQKRRTRFPGVKIAPDGPH